MKHDMPEEIRLQQGRAALTLVYGGAAQSLPAEFLRVYSPSAEVRGQPFKQRRNRQLFVVGHGDAELCGQVFQTVQHICPSRIIGLGDLGDVGLPIAGMVFVQPEGTEQCLDDGSNVVEHENARAFVVVVCHAGSFRGSERSQPMRTMASAGIAQGRWRRAMGKKN